MLWDERGEKRDKPCQGDDSPLASRLGKGVRALTGENSRASLGAPPAGQTTRSRRLKRFESLPDLAHAAGEREFLAVLEQHNVFAPRRGLHGFDAIKIHNRRTAYA